MPFLGDHGLRRPLAGDDDLVLRADRKQGTAGAEHLSRVQLGYRPFCAAPSAMARRAT